MLVDYGVIIQCACIAYDDQVKGVNIAIALNVFLTILA
jgi:hypothetical protein